MYSPAVNLQTDTTIGDDPTSILRVFGDFNSRVRSSTTDNQTSASQRLRLVANDRFIVKAVECK